MRRALLAFASLTALAACDGAPEANVSANEIGTEHGTAAEAPAGISNATVRLPAVAGRPGAAYFTFRNEGEARVLTSVSSDKAERAEIHESKMEDGVMRMGKLESLAIPAGETVTLASGGTHIMLFGLDPALKAGDTVALDLKFEDGTAMRAEAKAQTVAGDAGSHNVH
ncbi:copper chaperone PCu(A)C [Allosphingosinicella vermicomposti]|uniref:copper chaperone PCu(A)C n=1 Tax=Allosphingosinicella vermicomposti TaxID=614671 RepID=UPI00131A4D50|nr:copper chaperone PCu(A)C [Allosphingosinicella vermicomposti]